MSMNQAVSDNIISATFGALAGVGSIVSAISIAKLGPPDVSLIAGLAMTLPISAVPITIILSACSIVTFDAIDDFKPLSFISAGIFGAAASPLTLALMDSQERILDSYMHDNTQTLVTDSIQAASLEKPNMPKFVIK